MCIWKTDPIDEVNVSKTFSSTNSKAVVIGTLTTSVYSSRFHAALGLIVSLSAFDPGPAMGNIVAISIGNRCNTHCLFIDKIFYWCSSLPCFLSNMRTEERPRAFHAVRTSLCLSVFIWNRLILIMCPDIFYL